MKLSKLALDNPAAYFVILTLLVILGLQSLFVLPTQLFPNVDYPRISVEVNWRVAAPEDVESEILEPLETELQGAPGLLEMRGVATQGNAFVELTFSMDTDINEARLEVIERLNRRSQLPLDAQPPTIQMGGGRGFAGNSNLALSYFYIQVTGSTPQPIDDYFDLIEEQFAPQIRNVPGVAGVRINEGAPRNLYINIDPYETAERGVPIDSIIKLVREQNDVSAGYISEGFREYLVKFDGQTNVDELRKLIVASQGDKPVYLGDLAQISIERGTQRSFTYQNGQQAIAIRVDRHPDASVLATLSAVKEKIATLRQSLLKPNGLEIEISFDPSVFIQRAIQLIIGSLTVGLILTIGTIHLFLRNATSTWTVALVIPITLLICLLAMRITDVTLNLVSLAGLAFSVGLIADAAIVLVESINRSSTAPDASAILSATGRVSKAIFASTLTTVAVFTPILFLENIEGQLFSDLSITIATAVCASMLISLTLIPLFAARLQQTTTEQPTPRFDRISERFAQHVTRMTDSRTACWAIAAILIFLPVCATYLASPEADYLPNVKRDALNVYVAMPPGASVETSQKIAETMMDRLTPFLNGEAEPAIKNYFVLSFSPLVVSFGIRPENQEQTNDLITLIRSEILRDLPDVRGYISAPNLFGNFNTDTEIHIRIRSQSHEERATAAAVALQILRETFPTSQMRAEPILASGTPTLLVTPKDQLIMEAGMTRASIGRLVQIFGDGHYIGDYLTGEERLDTIVRSSYRVDTEEMATVPILNAQGQPILLGQLAEVEKTQSQPMRIHINGLSTQLILLTPHPDLSMQRTLHTLHTEVKPLVEARFPNVTVEFGGGGDRLSESHTSLLKNLLGALLVLFIVLIGIFGSVRDSLFVLASLPLASFGGMLALGALSAFTTQSLDLLTFVGFAILIGLVINNAILLLIETRSLQQTGKTSRHAVQLAVQSRTRPIAMTTVTTICGVLPLLLVPGAGSEIYRGMAAVIVGGMLLNTALTFVLIPAMLRLERRNSNV